MSGPGIQLFTGGDRFTTITPDDHGGILWVASIICAIYVFLSMGLRAYVKREFYGLDDLVALVATFIAEAQYIAIFFGLSDGLGKYDGNFGKSHIRRIGRSLLLSEVFFLLGLLLAKVSLILLIRRLFSPDMRTHILTCDATLVLSILWGVGSMLGALINCSPAGLMAFVNGTCSDIVLRWQAIGALDAFTELIIFGVAISVVWGIQMTPSRKARVLMAFIPRLPIIIFTILHIERTMGFTKKPKPSVSIVAPLVYQQIELCYSLVSCTIPNLGGYLLKFNTGMGITLGYVSEPYGSSREAGGSDSVQLSSLKSIQKDNKPPASDPSKPSKYCFLRPEQYEYRAYVRSAVNSLEMNSSDGEVDDRSLSSRGGQSVFSHFSKAAMPRSLTIKQIEGKPGQVYCPLQLNEVPKPVPGSGEVLVKIHAAALNHRDFFVRQHLYPGISFTSPLPCDGCGTVVEVGPDCTVAASTILNKLVILLPCLGWDSKFDGPEDMAKYAIIGAPNRYPHGAAQGYIVVRESEVKRRLPIVHIHRFRPI
ncbi:hypothetical protein MauCBS54593_004509 [Microsporum audouinii]